MIEELLNQVRLIIDSKRSNASCIWFCETGLSQRIVSKIDAWKATTYGGLVFHQTLIVAT